MRSKIIFLFVLLFLSLGEMLLDTHAQETCTGSSQPVIVEICRELQRAERPDRVTRREFRYESPRPNVSITIEPKAAFTIEKLPSPSGSLFLIKIVEPSLLFRTEGGLTFPIQVTLQESSLTGATGTIRIDADSRCETIMEFRQAGEPLNLDILGKRFDLQWLYPANLLSKPEVLGTQVRVKRLGQGEATLTLVVRDGTVEIARATRAVLDCSDLPRTPPTPSEAVIELMTPTRCYKPLGTRVISINNGIRHFYNAQNVCTRPIRCEWIVWVSHFRSAADADSAAQNNSDAGSLHTSGRGSYWALIPGRTGDANGERSASFDIVTSESVAGAPSLYYWHRFNVANCTWAE